MDKCTATTLLSPLCLAALVPFAGLAGAAPALAPEPAPELRSVQSVTVSYRDLNLMSVDGVVTLDQRIHGAARMVCGYEGRSLMEQRQWRDCYQGATARAVASVNNPLLTAVHGGEKVETP